MNSDCDISEIFSELEVLLQSVQKGSSLSPYVNKDSQLTNINYTLLRLYRLIQNNDRVGVTQVLSELINPNNIFDQFSDNHLHFILITVLLNTLSNVEAIMSPDKNPALTNRIDFNFMKLIHFKLLTRVFEELFQSGLDCTNWKYAINLVEISNIPSRFKKFIGDEIIFNKIEIAKEDENFLLKAVDIHTVYQAIGFYNLSRLEYLSAYENFKSSKDFNKASEIFLFNIFPLKLLDENLNNHTYEEINVLTNLQVKSPIWEIYGSVFFQYLLLLRKLEGDEFKRLELIDASFIKNLIKRVDAMKISQNYNQNLKILLNLCRNKILTDLRRIYNKKNEIESAKDQNVKFLLTIFFN